MPTLVAAPAAMPPAKKNLPRVMIVGGTPESRDQWELACLGVETPLQHHFIGPWMAARRIREGFPTVGLIIELDDGESLAEGKLAELMVAIEASYRGPVWVSDWRHGEDDEQLRTRMLLNALNERVDYPLRTFADDGWVNPYERAIRWIIG